MKKTRLKTAHAKPCKNAGNKKFNWNLTPDEFHRLVAGGYAALTQGWDKLTLSINNQRNPTSLSICRAIDAKKLG